MGQFEFESAAALDHIKNEELLRSLVRTYGSKVAAIGGILAEFAGMSGAATIGDFCSNLIDLASGKDESNLKYFAEAVVQDIRRLYRQGEEIRRIVEENLRKKETGEILANATLYVPRTNVEARLQRLAHIFANGIQSGKLEPESTDDMMRAAVDLKDTDIVLLGKIYESQLSLVTRQWRSPGTAPDGWHSELQRVWREFVNHGALNPQEHLRYRSSLSRLASFGLIQQIDIANRYGIGLDIYALLVEGKEFCERIQEIKH